MSVFDQILISSSSFRPFFPSFLASLITIPPLLLHLPRLHPRLHPRLLHPHPHHLHLNHLHPNRHHPHLLPLLFQLLLRPLFWQQFTRLKCIRLQICRLRGLLLPPILLPLLLILLHHLLHHLRLLLRPYRRKQFDAISCLDGSTYHEIFICLLK